MLAYITYILSLKTKQATNQNPSHLPLLQNYIEIKAEKLSGFNVVELGTPFNINNISKYLRCYRRRQQFTSHISLYDIDTRGSVLPNSTAAEKQ